jgi:hypothetical protein
MKRLAFFYVLADVLIILLALYIYKDDVEHWADYLFCYTIGMMLSGTFYNLKMRHVKGELEAADS